LTHVSEIARARRRNPTALSSLLICSALVALLAGCAPAAALTPAPGATATPTPAPTPTPTPTPSPTPSPTPCLPTAATNGTPLPCAQAARGTRKPIVVMIDDHPDARPQTGLSLAEVVYQAPAEGGVARYMAVYQAADVSRLGPVRSARLYFVLWAAEWRALYAHVGGAPNALRKIRELNGRVIWDADEYRWGGVYFSRSRDRVPPYNTYSSTTLLRRLATRLRATAPFTTTPWTFLDASATPGPKAAGRLVVPYTYNRITYRYDRATNRYQRGVTGQSIQKDALNGRRIAPANVIVLYMSARLLPDSGPRSTNQEKGRIDLRVIGGGNALVLRNGEVIRARWSKASESAPTKLTFASGCNAGQPVPLVRGQIFIQVVPTTTKVGVTGPAATQTC
jgi:hypothetical protein